MSKITEVCMGVAVAGVIAGAGCAVGTAVANAEPNAADSTASTTADGTAHRSDTGPRTRSRGTAAKSEAATQTKNGDRPGAAVRTRPVAGIAAASAAAPRRPALTPSAVPPVAAAQTQPVPSALAEAEPRARARSAAAQPVATPAAPASAPVAPAPDVPANPAPAPVGLPIPALPPSAPASAVTVNVSQVTSRSRSRAASSVAAQLADPPPSYVLLIGVDGANLSKILADPANVGFFDLMDESVTGATSIVGHTTLSGPSWSTVMTGVWDNKTGVINNIFNPKPYDSWPTVVNLLEYTDSSIETAVVADWRYINDMAAAGGYPADTNEFIAFDTSWADTDGLVVDRTIDLISNASETDSTFIFSYQVQIDEAGHEFGGGSPEYKAAVTNVSDNIAEIMIAVAARELATGEDWTVIVTTDHGHQQSVGFGHGFQSPNETSSFVIADIAGDSANDGKQNLDYSMADITPTVLDLFGVSQRSDFDGAPLQTKTSSIVSPVDLKQGLTDAIGMYGYPNIGTNVALGVRTVVGSVPYFLGIITDTITTQLQAIVEQEIFLISGLAGVAEFMVQVTGDVLVAVTQAVARAVGYLTGAGTIPPSDAPLPVPPANSVLLPAISLV